jgi:3-hydroxyacyl-CoA dehydrogenase
MVEAKLITESQIDPILKRIRPGTDLAAAAADADLAIECVVEDREAKKVVFADLDRVCRTDAILASNSSFLDIFEFVRVSHPERLMMIHWYAPPQIIPLVDVVKGPQTSQENLEAIVSLLRQLNKKPIVFNKPCAGYVVSRLQVAAQREVYWLLDNGYISPRDLDEATIWGLAFRMVALGICQRIDFGGLDLSARTIKEAPQQCTPLDYQPQKLLDLVQQGALGVKTGRGFYDYRGKSEAEVCHERDIRLLKLLKFLQESDLAGPIE